MSEAEAATSELAQGKCVPCRKGAVQPLSEDEVHAKLESTLELQGWSVQPVSAESGALKALTKTYRFKNFKTALAFTNAVGELAEEAGHHPRLTTEWGSLQVSWWTHVIGGLHENDFIMAAKTEQASKEASGIKA